MKWMRPKLPKGRVWMLPRRLGCLLVGHKHIPVKTLPKQIFGIGTFGNTLENTLKICVPPYEFALSQRIRCGEISFVQSRFI